MADFLRMVTGLLLLPACWAATRTLADAIVAAAGSSDGLNAGLLALLGGIVAFAVGWVLLPHPVRTYVFGHELTHALWGLLFGARPSALRVGARGGSVSLTKTNVFITLAPYFFPFYTFLVSLAALAVWLVAGRLPGLPAWLFLVGFTWSFHFLFTLETLAQRQPDVALYGRLFSWTFIYLGNVLFVVLWLAVTTDFTFARLGASLAARAASAYAGVGAAFAGAFAWIRGRLAPG